MSNSLYSDAFEALPLSAAVLDATGQIVAVNAAWRNFACENGGEAAGYVGGNYFEVCARADDPAPRELADTLRSLIDGSRERVEIEYPCHSPDAQRWFLMQASRVDSGSKVYVLVCHTNITQRRLAEEEARRRAEYDELTGLLSRASFQQRLKQALSRAARKRSRVAMFFLDLDGFKPINDRFGHDVGDEVLAALGARLDDNLRDMDAIARAGGDEFTFFAEEVNTATAHQIAEKIRTVVTRPLEVRDYTLTLSGSVGVSLYPDDGADAETVIRIADERMYASKPVRQGDDHHPG